MSDGKKPPMVSDLRTKDDVYQHYAPETANDEIPSWAMPKKRDALRTEVDTGNQLRDIPRPVTPGAKDTLDIRIVKDIFDTKECKDWYVKKLREAIETMKGDKLYDYIRNHSSYSVTSYLAWNKDFARLIALSSIPPEYRGANSDVTNRRITAAAQRVLVDEYENDVFQLTFTEEKINPWIYIDGKMGPYSVSVLNDYWMARYSKNSTKSPKPPGRSRPNAKDYPAGSKNATLFTVAMNYLNTQTKNMPKDYEDRKRDVPPEVNYGDRVRQKYAELDLAGNAITLKDLTVENHGFDLDMDFSKALVIVYKEELIPTNSAEAPKSYRLLNLLAQKIGPEVEKIKIKSGDTLNITAQGLFTITDKKGTVTRRVQLTNE